MLPEVVAEEVSVQLWEIFLLSTCGLATSSQTPVGFSGGILSNRQEGREADGDGK